MFRRRKSKDGKSEVGRGTAPGELPPSRTTPAQATASEATSADMQGDGLAREAATRPPLPPLYRQPTPLSIQAHGTWHLTPSRDYQFAAGTPLIPLNVAEFQVASRHYPIVFSAQGNMALAVVGASGANALVDDRGAWREGVYVPAYIRRYPFLFLRAPEEKYVLAIDAAYEGFCAEGDALFVDGEPTELVKNALAFCQVFEREIGATAKFIRGISDAEIMSKGEPTFSRASGRKLAVKGVRIVNQAAFDALPDETIGEWRRAGWLPAIYAHLASLSNWDMVGA